MKRVRLPTGRPTLSPEKHRGRLLSVRFTKAERAKLEVAARADGMRLSAWVRSTLLAAVKLTLPRRVPGGGPDGDGTVQYP